MSAYDLSTQEGRQRARLLANAATEGPWHGDPHDWTGYVFGPDGEMVADACHACDGVRIRGVGGRLPMKENKEFIVAARTLLPAALDEIDRLERQLANSRAELVEVRPGVWQAPNVRSVFSDGRDARCRCEVWQTCPYCHPEPKKTGISTDGNDNEP